MENNKVVYRHVRLDTNEVFYIGIGDYKRAFINTKGHRSDWWFRVTNKTEYRVDILFDGLTLNEAIEKEIEFIALYGRRDLGLGTLVNLTNGGEGTSGKLLSEETKRKIGKGNKGKVVSKESRLKMVESAKGKIMSEETKHKISVTGKGRIVTEEIRNKISKTKTGISNNLSDDARMRMGQRDKTGDKNGMFGRVHSEESRLKMSIAAKNRNKL